MELILTEHML